MVDITASLLKLFPAAWPADLSLLFCGLTALLAVLAGAQRLRTGGAPPKAEGRVTRSKVDKAATFGAFQREYLAVYLTIMLADWLQGTNMYTLYSGYGVSVSTLFLTGFSSSLVFGTFVGLLVDSYGRKRACVLFCLLEIVINALEHIPNMPLLLLGRVLGGISTSLLFSAFESWMVSEHRKRGFPEAWLKQTFSLAAAGNGFVAVFAGLLAQVAADARGDIGPFQLAIALTVLSLVLVLRWPENYGSAPSKSTSVLGEVTGSLSQAVKAFRADSRVALLAAVSALFEGATFTFVFMWVPALIGAYPYEGDLPTGLVFASFMLCITIGGVLYGVAVGDGDEALMTGPRAVERFSLLCLIASALAMAVPAAGASAAVLPQLAPSLAGFGPALAAFLVLETCVGAFQGGAATMRSTYIPEDVQAAVMNLGRVPLNFFVVAGTYIADYAPQQVAFASVAFAFACGAVLQGCLIASLAKAKRG